MSWRTENLEIRPYPGDNGVKAVLTMQGASIDTGNAMAALTERLLAHVRPLLAELPEAKAAADLCEQVRSLQVEQRKAELAADAAKVDAERADLDGLKGDKLAKRLLACDNARQEAERTAAQMRQALTLLTKRVQAALAARDAKVELLSRQAAVAVDHQLHSRQRELEEQLGTAIAPALNELIEINETFGYLRSDAWRLACITQALGDGATLDSAAMDGAPAEEPDEEATERPRGPVLPPKVMRSPGHGAHAG